MLYILLLYVLSYVNAHDIKKKFTSEDCLQVHNNLRELHEDTRSVELSTELGREAQRIVDQYALFDVTSDVRPTRVLPKRRRRHADDIDPNLHLEQWDGEIYFAEGRWAQTVDGQRVGASYHKYCCRSQPHCPREFFHGLGFPPSAEGVVKDWYNQEIGNYDFETGRAFMNTEIKHFSNIVWRNTTKIGCAQSKISSARCVFTLAVYQVEGSIGTPKNFMKNIGRLKYDTGKSSNRALIIFLAILFVILLIGIVMLMYCCRENLRAKYLTVKIKVDTLKAEQELETDSTNFWWLRLFRRKKAQRRRTIVSRPKQMSLKEKPTIELIPNTAPQREKPIPPRRIMGSGNTADLVMRYQGIGQKKEDYAAFKHKPLPPSPTNGINNTSYHPPVNRVSSNSSAATANVGRQPSLSGKPPPPPVPLYCNAALPLSNQVKKDISPKPETPTRKPLRPPPLKTTSTSQSEPPKAALRPHSVPVKQVNKPSPVPRKNTSPIFEESEPSKPQPPRNKPLILPTKPARAEKKNNENVEDDEKPKSVSEMRRLLEKR